MKAPGTTGQVIVACGVLAMAAVAAYQTTLIPVSPIYAKVGPTVFPWMVAGGLGVLGLTLLMQALRNRWGDDLETQGPLDWQALGWLLLGLVLNVALIQFLGFILASLLLFCCVARAFGSRHPLRDALIAIVFSAATYVGFARILGINIGSGLLERFL